MHCNAESENTLKMLNMVFLGCVIATCKLGYNKRSYKVENLAKLFNQDSENGNQIRKTIKSENAFLILRAKKNGFSVQPMN